ncbi:conserved hypothetical protein [Leishmania infantum JPCM5]|uniref:Uncharacterized protein n=3 Tax=Leishmania donovani species complex TaxID=38574 RepID=A4I7Y5_LEIIN|nr:conserved hypothetical protein [Leishmania infantum JPCM5]CAM70922.1 conserved hypothetical protein [Leishmania infantum JPCM5]|eukprot:XP_001467854.1 conserved hypothetical protein [Leishmania infantum JPCM5]
MQSLSKYKETIVFVSCATLLLGTVLVLQKATTPSRHRRRAALSVSRAGTVTRSASHGAAGARSRSSSRPRVAHMSHAHNSAAPTTATAIDRIHAAKSRELSQAHSHRHHSHPRNGGVWAEAATSRIESSDATPPPKLTVEAVAQHKKALGTASALQDPGHSDLAGIHAPRRGVSSSGYRVNGGSGSVEDGAYYRSASNAATVGSQAPSPAPATATTVGTEKVPSEAAKVAEAMTPWLASPAVVESSRVCFEGTDRGRKEEADRNTSPQPATGTAKPVRVAAAAAAPAATKAQPSSPSIRASTAQTDPRWFCEDRGTQTETSAMQDAIKSAASATPDRWLAAAMMSPIMPTGENVSDSMLIHCADLGWTPLHDGAASTGGAVHAEKRACEHTQPPVGDKAESVVIPRYFLRQLERQLRLLVDDLAQEEWNERAWMCLYTYLSELPLSVRTSLTSRDRCSAATVAQLVDRMMANALTEGNLVEETVAMANKSAEQNPIPSLPREVLHLLQHSTAIDPEFHFEWKGSTVAYVEGPLGSASRRARKSAVASKGEVGDLPHVLPPSSSLSSTSVALTDDEEERSWMDDEEVGCTSRFLSFIAAHIKKYSDLRLRGAATQFPEPGTGELRTPPGATGVAQAGAYELSTPPTNRRSDADTALQHQFRDQQDQLASILASFVRLRHTPLFQTLRHTSEHALFACDFIELASAAERLLERASPASAATLLLEIPMEERRVMTEATDARDTSVGTSTSVGSGSSPTTGPSARHSVRVRTPMKPSIRHPIQRMLSNLPSPSGLSSRRSTQMPDMYKQLYSPPVHAGEEERGRTVSVATMRGGRLAAETWAA